MDTDEVVNQLAFKLMLTELALQEVIRHLPSAARADIAACFQSSVSETLRKRPVSPTPNEAEQIRLSIEATLEACGQPPIR